MVKLKFISLVKFASKPTTELIGPFWMGNVLIDSIELIGEDDFRLNIWIEDYEIQIPSDKVTIKEMENLMEQIEEILFN